MLVNFLDFAWQTTTDNTITNGDFETGDLTGWTVKGEIAENPTCEDETFRAEKIPFKIPFNKGGNYFFNGWYATEDEGAAYSLKSTTFTLGGSGFITFKMGGSAAVVKVFLEDGQQVAEYANTEFILNLNKNQTNPPTGASLLCVSPT